MVSIRDFYQKSHLTFEGCIFLNIGAGNTDKGISLGFAVVEKNDSLWASASL